ncbi:hypothetical protein ACH4TS_14855 [Streptomyces albidoflavus]
MASADDGHGAAVRPAQTPPHPLPARSCWLALTQEELDTLARISHRVLAHLEKQPG